MEEAETPRKGFWAKNKFVLIALAIVLTGGFAWYGFARGFGPLSGVWRGARSLAAKTFRDILGSGGGAELAAEIDILNSATSSFVEEQNSSYLGVYESSSAAQTSGNLSGTPEVPRKAKSALIEKETHVIVKDYSLPAAAQDDPEVESPVLFSTSMISDVSSSPKNTVAVPACGFEAANEPTHQILFNEIAWMGSPALAGWAKNGETGAQASNREWIELRDNAGVNVDLSAWQIMNTSQKLKIILDDGAHIDFGGFFLLERGDDNSVPDIAADKVYSGTLPNTGDWLRLFDRNCRLIDEINASSGSTSLPSASLGTGTASGWPGGDNSTKATLERDLMDLDWHTSGFPGGTPKAQNSVVWKGPSSLPVSPQFSSQATLLVGTSTNQISNSALDPVTSSTIATSTAAESATSSLPEASSSDPLSPPVSPPTPTPNVPAHLVIAAVQIAGVASTNDFIKIFNPTGGVIDASGWKLRKRTSTGTENSVRVFPAGSFVQPQNYFTWANSANGFAASIGADASSSETLAADNSTALEDATSAVIDAVAWGTGLTNPFVEGTPYPDNPAANQTLARKFAGGTMQDTDDNSQDFRVQ